MPNGFLYPKLLYPQSHLINRISYVGIPLRSSASPGIFFISGTMQSVNLAFIFLSPFGLSHDRDTRSLFVTIDVPPNQSELPIGMFFVP
jgi:hypothetical protein